MKGKSRQIGSTLDTRHHKPAFAGEAGDCSGSGIKRKVERHNDSNSRHLMASGIFLLHSWRWREGGGGEAIKRELALRALTPLKRSEESKNMRG